MLPDISTASIVLVGKFNISDFLPKTMVKNGIIEDRDLAEIEWNAYVPFQVLDINFLWGQMTVTPQQLIVIAKDTPHITASDFVRSVMACVSEDVKAVAMGINFEAHFKFDYSFRRNNIGTKLVPPSAWGQWGKEVQEQIDTAIEGKINGGMVVSILRKLRNSEDGLHGHTDVRVQPSAIFQEAGIHIIVNDHYQFDTKVTYTDANLNRSDIVDRKTELMNVLDKKFDTSIAASLKIMSGILEGA